MKMDKITVKLKKTPLYTGVIHFIHRVIHREYTKTVE
jgi:hypothetical protein